MFRYFIYIFTILVSFSIAVIFAASNPGLIKLDLAFIEIEIQKSMALILCLGAGWILGMLCSVLFLLKGASKRRQLRKALKLAEAEVKSLRNMPIQDAD
ncbi:MAG: LapA family protein [Pseudomonadota bacterium]|nr:LapA family protein [Pseudomonadota bacterium]